jgi:hypothetical protein
MEVLTDRDLELIAEVKMRFGLFLAPILLLTGAAPPVAQVLPCASVQAVPGAMGYQRRPIFDGCEGLYQSPVAGESLEILSFITGKIIYDLGTDKTLVFAAPDVARLQAKRVNLQARALPLGTYYRMDAMIDSGGTMTLPLSTVLRPAGLQPDMIGIIGWVERGADEVYVPISVAADRPPSFGSERLTIVLRSPVNVERLQWRSWPDDRSVPPSKWKTVGGDDPSEIRAGEPIQLILDQKAPGPLVVDISAKRPSSDDFLRKTIRVLVP